MKKASKLRKGVLRRDSTGQRAWRVFALASIAVLGCLTYGFVSRVEPKRAADLNPPSGSLHTPHEILAADANTQQKSDREVYPYSIVPGGIGSVAELKSAMARDSVVFAQYSAFHLERARVIRLDRDRFVHVSYRVGDRIYWTKGELRLKKGETLITDGLETARTKCGNLVSDTLETPISPNEPTEAELDAPIGTNYNPGPPVSDNRFPELEPPPANLPPLSYSPPPAAIPWTVVEPGPGGPGTFFVPPPTPIRYPSGSTPPPVISAPEPGTAIQLLLAVPAILFFWKRSKAKAALEAARRSR